MASDSSVFSREEILDVLKGMNIDVLPSTKLPIYKLEQRLQKALDAAQRFDSVFPRRGFSMKPTMYPVWDTNKLLHPDFIKETYAAPLHVKDVEVTKGTALNTDAFARVSDHINDLSTQRDNIKGRFNVLFLNPVSNSRGLLIRILSVHNVNASMPVPLIFVGYMFANEAKGWEDYLDKCLVPKEAVIISWVTPLEQNLLLKLLSQNSQQISTDFQPPPSPGLKFSFFIPITGLRQTDIVRLSKNSGCVVCGKNTMSTCSACLSVQYCGKSCQKNDWRTHKHFCRSIISGKWYTVTLDRNPRAMVMDKLSPAEIAELRHQPGRNRFDSKTEVTYRNWLDKSPFPNAYDDGEYFLVKIQRPNYSLFGIEASELLIYDGKKTFETHLLRGREPEAFKAALVAIGSQRKIYRWACRVGDFQWRICFDSAPEHDPSW